MENASGVEAALAQGIASSLRTLVIASFRAPPNKFVLGKTAAVTAGCGWGGGYNAVRKICGGCHVVRSVPKMSTFLSRDPRWSLLRLKVMGICPVSRGHMSARGETGRVPDLHDVFGCEADQPV